MLTLEKTVGFLPIYAGQMEPASCSRVWRGPKPVNAVHLIHMGNVKDVARLNPKNLRMKQWLEKADAHWNKHHQWPWYLREVLDQLAYKAIGHIKMKTRGISSQAVLIFVPWLTKDFEFSRHYKTHRCLAPLLNDGESRCGECEECRLYDQAKALREEILAGIRRAINAAAEYGAGYVGLGAFTSIFTENGILVEKESPIPITSGSDGTAYGLQLCIERAARQLGISLKRSTLTFVGASGSVGRRGCLLLARRFGRIILSARNRSGLEGVRKMLLNNGIKERRIVIETDINRAVSQADVIVLATSAESAAEVALDHHAIRPGSLVADVGKPPNFATDPIALAQLPFLVVDGANIRFPGEFQDESWKLLDQGGQNAVWGCSAETFLRGLTGEKESTSVGSQRSIKPLLQVVRMMKRYGFRVADLRSGGSPMPVARLEEVRRIRQQESRRQKVGGKFFYLMPARMR
ncbi:hypothetical protein HYW32_02775 [Candidatus Berkelbacteria bacterium]|nr:hypothetical protein [Candidatus Berkelbacteria bacterium]